MKEVKIILLILFAAINLYGQTCHFTSDGNWDKSTTAGFVCDAGVPGNTPDNASLIYIDPGITVTIEQTGNPKQIIWDADLIVQGTLILNHQLVLGSTSSCGFTLTVEEGGTLISGNGNDVNEQLIICGELILGNGNGGTTPLWDWNQFPGGISGPASIDDTGGTLPVELTSFTAKTNSESVVLSWSTASEQNNDYFTLERSRNGKEYEVIGQVHGNGTINTTMNYSFTDEDPYLGLSFYRLSQTDFDGAFEVFPAISVIFTDKSASFSINPNPIINQTVNLKVSGKAKKEWLTLNIIDAQGKLLEQKTFQTDQFGNVDIEFFLDKQLQKGIYIFELVSETQHEYLKVAGK